MTGEIKLLLLKVEIFINIVRNGTEAKQQPLKRFPDSSVSWLISWFILDESGF